MKYSFAALAFAAGALAYGNATTNGTYYTTEVVTALTTVCPSATEITQNGVTYTVTEATTLTITDCPCTLTHTKPIPAPSTVLYTSCPPSGSGAPPAPPLKSIAPPPAGESNPLTVIYSSTTTVPGGHVGTGSATATPTGPRVTFTGSANSNRAAGVIVAVGALAAFAL